VVALGALRQTAPASGACRLSKARITGVKPVPGENALQVEFANGKRHDVDLREHIRQFPVLKPLGDLSLFRTAQVGEWASM
jgi:DNA segregation ATPase FtsK/SpoIIIE-like protein